MGNWFSNMHIRKKEGLTGGKVTNALLQMMCSQQYEPVELETDADGALIVINSESSEWFSVYSNLIPFVAPAKKKLAKPLSKELHTDVLCIADYDSDLVYMNLINADERVNAWAAVGQPYALSRLCRLNLGAWKKKVTDFDKFKTSFRAKYLFAEDVLDEIEELLCLPRTYSGASFEDLEEFGTDAKETKLYFRLTALPQQNELPKLRFWSRSLMPCSMETANAVSVLNMGSASKGLSVYFIGSYVEKDEITFSDVCFSGHSDEIPVELTKIQLQDGQWAYYYHASDLSLPPKIDGRLPMRRQMDMESERKICLKFTPHGNKRKLLDITVVLVPDENPAGQIGWNVWQEYGSKAEYIKEYNARFTSDIHPPLKESDFD